MKTKTKNKTKSSNKKLQQNLNKLSDFIEESHDFLEQKKMDREVIQKELNQILNLIVNQKKYNSFINQISIFEEIKNRYYNILNEAVLELLYITNRLNRQSYQLKENKNEQFGEVLLFGELLKENFELLKESDEKYSEIYINQLFECYNLILEKKEAEKYNTEIKNLDDVTNFLEENYSLINKELELEKRDTELSKVLFEINTKLKKSYEQLTKKQTDFKKFISPHSSYNQTIS